jgi:hypothetical protein
MNDIPLPESPPVPTALALATDPLLERMVTDLEQRVLMLEQTVSRLQDTRQLEERITERVATRLPPPPDPPPPPQPALPASTLQTAVESSWLLFDLLADARAMLAMLFDRRYTMAWLTRVVAVLLLLALFTSSWWCPLWYVPFVGAYLDKLLDLCLALLVFLLLSREARRYREWRARR